MNDGKYLILHQKSKSINNNLSLKDFSYNNTNIHSLPYNCNNNKYKFIEEFKNKEMILSHNFGYNIEDMKQNILDIYYDKNSEFKQKIDNLNLQFYLETEKYLNCNKNSDIISSQKLQANLFIILFKQINIFIEEIERLNKIIIENKYKKETILKRTNEINEKTQNFIIKENLIQCLKQSNNKTEKRLFETLLHEDKLIKDNERLRKENETYKSLTTVFENELKNNRKNGPSSPKGKNYIKHIKTYSDYGLPSISMIGEISGGTIGKCQTLNYRNLSPLSDKKLITINNINSNRNKEFCLINKHRNIFNNKKNLKNKNKKINSKINSPKNNYNKINNCQQLLRNNTLKESIKISLNKPLLNSNQKNKKSQDKKEDLVELKNRTKKDLNINKNFVNKNKIIMNHNLRNNNSCNNKKSIFSDKNIKNKFIKNNNNLKLNLNNINSTINTIMTENNNENEKIKYINKLKMQTGYLNKKNISDIALTDTTRNHNLKDEINNLLNNNQNKLKKIKNKFKKSESKKYDGKKPDKIETNNQ